MDFQVQDTENQWPGSNRASFAWLQYKPRHPSKGMSLDPRKEKCLTLVFPWSEERFDCTKKKQMVKLLLKMSIFYNNFFEEKITV